MTCPTTRPRLYQNGQANSSRQNDFARPDDSVGRVGLVAGRALFRRAISLAGLPLSERIHPGGRRFVWRVCASDQRSHLIIDQAYSYLKWSVSYLHIKDATLTRTALSKTGAVTC